MAVNELEEPMAEEHDKATVKIGREGWCSGPNEDSQTVMEVELKKGQGPRVERITHVAYSPERGRVTAGQPIQHDAGGRRTSRSGNGRDRYTLGPGLYVVHGSHGRSGRRHTEVVKVTDNGEPIELETEAELLQAAAEIDPTSAHQAREQEAAAERERRRYERLSREIAAEREYFVAREIDGYKVMPRWGDLPRQFEVERDDDEIVAEYAEPTYWMAEKPFVKADTAEEAAEKAAKIERDREAEKERAEELAAEQGLPELTGSPKQVAWAQQIRGKYIEQHGNDGTAKRATRAKYWIDNHKHLTQRGR